ncbi:MAG: S9 family peptidase [Thermoanaerobaculales bacterium]|jgi:oligopeptidase B|nr:S9 family peptidase [Thermoanaerobaculales bacterium]
MKTLAKGLLVATAAASLTCLPAAPRPPVAAVAPHQLEIHGDVRTDPYFWLRDPEDPAVVAYLEAENAYADAVMAPTLGLQERLVAELAGRTPQTDASPPVPDRGYLYYERTEEGLDYPIHCRVKDAPGASEEVLLDVNALAEGHTFCSVEGLRVSPVGDLMAWALDTVGRRKYTLRFTDLTTGEGLADEIHEVTDNAEWANDGRTVLYTRQDPETLRWFQVWRHVVGTDPAADVLVFEEEDETYNVSVDRTASGRYLLIVSWQTLASEVRLVDADDPTRPPVVVEPRQRGVEYEVDHHGDRLLIRTNLEAPSFRLMSAPVASPGRASWQELVPHRDDVLLSSVRAFRDFVVLSERKDGLSRLTVWRPATGEAEVIELEEAAYDVWLDDNREYDTPFVRFGYSSLVTPTSIWDLDTRTGERRLVKQDRVLGGYDPGRYVVERLTAPARDGVGVPISLVHRADLELDGSAPLLLHGYGAYGSNSDPVFDPEVISLLDRGFSYAIAHVRGGQELGRRWYEDGRLLAKKNSFNDFVDCARFLVDRGYTSPERLVASGRSAGGLLMGAVATMAPELFAGIVAEVPFVDVVTTMLDRSIPLTSEELDEWGDPADPELYAYMLSYSPYDQVATRAYPAMMVTTGLHDSQVQYWEPAKWVAKLRATKTDDNLLVLRTAMDSGHGGASSRSGGYRERAEVLAFLLMAVGAAD